MTTNFLILWHWAGHLIIQTSVDWDIGNIKNAIIKNCIFFELIQRLNRKIFYKKLQDILLPYYLEVNPFLQTVMRVFTGNLSMNPGNSGQKRLPMYIGTGNGMKCLMIPILHIIAGFREVC